MKPVPDATLFLMLILFGAAMIPGVSAYTVTSYVSPAGNQPPGTPLTVSIVVDFSSGSAETFSQAGELQMSTDLIGPHWAPALVLDGRETRFPEESVEKLTIAGWYLSYPRGSHEQLKVTLTGTTPANPSPHLDLVKVQEADAGNNIISTARVHMPDVPLVTQSALITTETATVKKTTVRKTFTPIPTDTPQPESPLSTGSCLLAVGVAIAVMAGRR